MLLAFVSGLALVATASSTFVKTNGLRFELNGQPYTFGGTNYWSIAMVNSSSMTSAIENAKTKSMSVIRVAAWNEKDPDRGKDPGSTWFQSWTGGEPTINDGPNGLGLLDDAVKAAEAAGIKFIMCLTNNWQDYGGMDTYTWNVLGTQGFTHTSFYVNDKVIDSYKRYVAHIVNKYKDSPAIFAWELANEARCSDKDCQGTSVLTAWADKMSAYIKTLDSNHMVTFGGYGYMNMPPHNWDFMYDGQSGEDFSAIAALPAIDFATVHHYTDSNTNVNLEYGMQWLKDHDEAAVKVNKPLIVEEIGVTRLSADKTMDDVMGAYQKFICGASAIAGTLLWSTDLVGGACPVNGDPYAMCEADSCYKGMVLGFTHEMNTKGGGSAAVMGSSANSTNTDSPTTSSEPSDALVSAKPGSGSGAVTGSSANSTNTDSPTTSSEPSDALVSAKPANPAHNIPGLGIVNPPTTTSKSWNNRVSAVAAGFMAPSSTPSMPTFSPSPNAINGSGSQNAGGSPGAAQDAGAGSGGTGSDAGRTLGTGPNAGSETPGTAQNAEAGTGTAPNAGAGSASGGHEAGSGSSDMGENSPASNSLDEGEDECEL